MDIATIQMLLVLALVVGVFIAFVTEIVAAEVAAMIAVGILLVAGVLTQQEVMGVFSNPAPMIVGCMFVLSAALERTGVVQVLAGAITNLASHKPKLAVGGLLGGVMLASIFVNNTSVVVIMTPIVIVLATSLNKPASKFLIPLSYVSIFAGTCTLIGSSTNLIVDGVARERGLEPFGMFEITIPGLILALVGALYLYLIGRHLLPSRERFDGFLKESGETKYMTKLMVPAKSPLIGKTLKEAGLVPEKGLEVINIVRNGNASFSQLSRVKLKENDRLVMLASKQELVGLHHDTNVKFDSDTLDFFETVRQKQPQHADARVVMEGIVGRRSSFIGKLIGRLNIGNQYDTAILAVHRQGMRFGKRFDRIRLHFGDKLLLEGTGVGLQKLFENRELINLSQLRDQPLRRNKAPIAIAAIAAMMGLAAFEVLPIVSLAMICAIAVIAFGCLEAEDAYRSVQWRILFLIFGMMAISVAMEKTGAAALIVNSVMALVDAWGPWAVLSVVYLLTSFMTEIFSNNAAAVILTGLAVSIAQQLGVDPRPFAVAVMFGASASFATPIGYQTNTFVYNAGGYSFTDFLKVGVPLNLLLWGVASLIIPLFWPL